MTAIEAKMTVGELVNQRMSRTRVFERFGVDYCCGGKTPLIEACAKGGVELSDVLEALREAEAHSPPDQEKDWSQESMSALVDHILATHHAYLREELPRLAELTEKVVAAHSERHPEVRLIREVFQSLKNELEMHMGKEEEILFPMVKQIEAGRVGAAGHCGSVANPIQVMEQEHDNAGKALARLRDLSGGFVPPEDACTAYRAMLDGLAGLEADLHLHIHKENNILFPRAIQAESRPA
jgi:regulator of cell morphogenesis and NO signaling